MLNREKKKCCSIALVAGVIVCAFVRQASATEFDRYREKVVYSFAGGADGAFATGLIAVNGKFYGATYGNPLKKAECCGTVFSFEPHTGTEKVLYSFCSGLHPVHNCNDGALPSAGVIYVDGILYGTTFSGGKNQNPNCKYANPFYGCGTAFSFDLRTGKERVLHAFCNEANCADGSIPQAGLTDVNGTLYGTAPGGGADMKCGDPDFLGCGVVFSLDRRTGAETVIHAFGTGIDGAYPYAGLINVNGTLYGTTAGGGANQNGTVFSLDPKNGTETVLYSFCQVAPRCADGSMPFFVLVSVDGKFYGTTIDGGTGAGCPTAGRPCGVVFSLDRATKAETVLYSFCGLQNCTDGADPEAGLLAVGDKLYGTTFSGGMIGGYCEIGCGTVFSVDRTTGAERLLYSFCPSLDFCPDGRNPGGGSMIAVNGRLYGAADGGSAGVIFELEKKH